MFRAVHAAVDVVGALAFVGGQGSARDRALLKVLLRDELTDGDLQAVTTFQNSDGGFRAPEVQGTQSLIGETAAAIIHLCALGAQEFGTTQAAVDFLLHHQRPGGRWGEEASLAEASLPPYFQPGSDDVDAWETAAGCLALLSLGLPLDHRPAARWLSERPCLKGGLPAFPFEPPLLYALFHRLQGPASAATAAAQRAAEAVDLAKVETWGLWWPVQTMRLVGVPAADPVVARLAGELEGRQHESGGFVDEGEPSGLSTVYALAALEMAGLITLDKRALPEPDEPDLADAARAL